ncbi:MAG: hypothetical protein JXA69_01970 [Phycisphaerae bacterium]|nr:hypothetical protein [Phycisphaerae bacterium]
MRFIRTVMLAWLGGLVGFATPAVAATPTCGFARQAIIVDGRLDDWSGIQPNVVQGREHLWFGQGMTPDRWRDDSDLSYQWRGAWFGNKLFFAFEVTDDHVLDPTQPSAFLCDCVEIYIDYANRGGRRVHVLDGREDWFAACKPGELLGYELQFLPTQPARVYLDHADKYLVAKPQTERFVREWAGEIVATKTAQGYLMEIGFALPDVAISAGRTMGIETGVCDDDGAGRESIMMWTGTKGDFWLTMDGYGKATLADGGEPRKPETRPIGSLATGAVVLGVQNADMSWGLRIADAGRASCHQPSPVQLEFYRESVRNVLPTSREQLRLWQYATSRPAFGWSRQDFDASDWRQGPGGFGVTGTPGAAVSTKWDTSDIWLRNEFDLDEVPKGLLWLVVHHDEDAQLFINGVEAARLRGYVTSYAEVQLADEAIAALKPGRNLLAVHCHQTGGGQFIDAGLVERTAISSRRAAGYDTLDFRSKQILGRASIACGSTVKVTVEDRWSIAGDVLHLDRTVKVSGDAPEGFLSAINLPFEKPMGWSQVDWFVPGMIYGGFDYLTETAIGGRAHYQPGQFTIRIREDRLPAPLLAARFEDGHTLAILNPAPRGDTTAADSLDIQAITLTDGRFRFGSIGAEERGDGLSVGYWFPGTEGEVTYRGDTYPGGHLHRWRRRYHPLEDGLEQHYQVAFRFGRSESFPNYMQAAWRWAWNSLKPAVVPVDTDTARRSLIDALASCVVQKDGRTGIPNFVDSMSKDLERADRKAIMGFTGKNLESAYFMLREASLPGDRERSQHLRKLAEQIIDSFVRLKIDPPAGEGFNLDDGRPKNALWDEQIYLRSFGDDIKILLKAYQHERKEGREHPDWLTWCRRFGDWLLTQQQEGGGFPRTWQAGSGKVVSASPNSSFNAIPLLTLLSQITGEARYLNAAARAAEFSWENGQARGQFVGGTIDNPDVLDKEAATLSLEAYLALYRATGDHRWVERARAAADFAETWIYIWDVPMPKDDLNAGIHWKHNVSTVGLQLIASGHSLVDAYMAFDADDYAELYRLTGDAHYFDVARLLLHNTKGMLAMPGRTYDLGVPGWQQEHWSLAPRRGYGLHRGWLPWVTTSHLNGIFGVMDLDRDLRTRLLSDKSDSKGKTP